MRRMFSMAVLAAAVAVSGVRPSAAATEDPSWPTNGWEEAAPADVGMDESLLEQARDFALTGGGSGFITRHGRLVMSWGSSTQRFDLKSTTKSIGVTVLGLALLDSLVNLEDLAQGHLDDFGIPPESNQDTGWLDEITLLHLATHTAGFDKPGGYVDLLYPPGTIWAYSDGGANWLADVLTVVHGIDLKDLMFARVFGPLGLDSSDLTWRSHAYRDDLIHGIKRREFGSGMYGNVDILARIGYLYLRGGMWEEQRIVPEGFVSAAGQPVSGVVGLPVDDPDGYPDASDHYGLLWWNNADGTMEGVPTDAFWSWGLYESLIIVIPSLDIVASRAGEGWRAGWDADYSVIEPFLTPIAQSVGDPSDVPWAGTTPARLLDVYPNPVRSMATIEISADLPGGVEAVNIHDLNGRLVRRFMVRGEGGSSWIVEWDGKDRHGAAVPSGVYFISLDGVDAQVKRIVRLR